MNRATIPIGRGLITFVLVVSLITSLGGGIPVTAEPSTQGAAVFAVAADYVWSQSIGTYTEITGGTVLTTSCDDTSYNNNAIPFTFTFNGVDYTAISVQCNGFIAMGATVSSSYAPISTGTSNNVVAALGMDLQTNTTGAELRMETLGTAPNRVVVVQWKNFRYYNATGDAFNFQIRLYETSNVVEVVYGDFVKNATSRTPQVGLRGASSADFNNRSSSTGWTNTVAGATNAATVMLSQAYLPPSGLTWTWTPVAPRPIFDTSTKSATGEVSVGGNISYDIRIRNSGTAAANAATLVDPIPAGTTYNGDVACSAGTCGFDGTNVTWAGGVPVGGEVTVTFSVNTTGLSCGAVVVNQATLDDPDLIGGPVVKSASTLVTGMVNDLLSEGFEVSVPPPGWTETIVNDPGIDPDWTRESVGANPTINPHGGGWMAKFNSFSAPAGASARLATHALDFSAVSTPRVVFWMSHDIGYPSSADQVQVQVSTDGGATWTDVGAPVLRYDAAYTTPGWGYHVVDLTGLGGAPSVMVGFLGISAYGNNFYLDDVAIQDVCGQPMVQVWPAQSGSACPGSSKTYTLNVRNVNLVSDTINIALSGNAWPTNVTPTLLTLGAGETGQVQVTVDVPWSAIPGSTDVVTVTGTAVGSAASGSAAVTTTAFPGGMDTAWVNEAVGGEPSLYWGGSYYYNGNVCVVGGLSGPSGSIVVSGAHWCYNIATATWTQKASMPTPLFGTAYGLIGGKFYMAGGFDINFTGYTNLQIYDIATDTWSSGAALPSARGGQAGGVVGGKLYSAGGSGIPSFPSDCPTYEYDPVSDTWTSKAACPLQGGYGFNLGGSVGSEYWGKLFAGGHFGAYYGWYAYDPVADAWSTLANLPYHKTPLIVENPNTGDIYSIGGFIGWAPQNATWKYDYAADTWTNLNLPQNTAQGGALGPAQGSFGDPNFQGFWTAGGTIGSGALSPAPFESWQFISCPTCTPVSNVDFTWVPTNPVGGEQVTFTGSAQGTEPLTYSWEFGDGGIGSGNPVSHTFVGGFQYVVTLIVSNACSQASAMHAILVAAPPNIDVSPSSLSSTQAPNTTTSQTLTIANTGEQDLTWAIAEEPKATAPEPAVLNPNTDPGQAAEVAGAMVSVEPEGQSVAPLSTWNWATVVLYDNGPLVTHPGAGAGGADASAVQSTLGNSTFGFGHAIASGYRVADDFTVPAGGWQIDTITFFAYQTGSTITSTINNVNLRIWDGVPGAAGSNIVFGDTTTNRLTSSTWSNIYRVTDTALTGTTRPIMADVVTVNTFLPAGTYWLDWQTGGTLTSGPWVPPVTILGQTGKPGSNSRQFDPTTGMWNDLTDNGNSAAQDLPFVIQGTVGVADCTLPADVPWLSVSPTNGSTAAGGTTPVQVTFDSTGLAAGVYNANLCITSNDPDAGPGNQTGLVIVPVELVVEEPPVEPSIVLTKTVGTVDGVCADTTEITVPEGTTVYYCYTVTNTGNVTLTLHDLDDDALGPIFAGLNYTLTPGSSVNTVVAGYTVSATITATTVNTATWTAYNVNGPSVTATATARVNVEPTAVGVTRLMATPSGAWSSIALLGVFALGGFTWKRKRRT